VTGKITRLGVSSNGKIVRNFARVGRVLEHDSKRCSFAITASTGHKEHVRKLGIDSAVSTQSGR
jgi:hypothetical protein